MKQIKIIIVTGLMLLCLAPGVFSQAASQAVKGSVASQADAAMQKAKQLIHQKKWQPAVTEFGRILGGNPGKDISCEALYWLAYALNQSAGDNDGDEHGNSAMDSVTAMKQAFSQIETLLRNFSDCKWAGAAKMLRLEIAEGLVDAGRKEYRKYISGAAQQEPDTDLKLVALDALLQMDKDRAFPIVEKIIRTNPDPQLKEKALFVLSQIDDSRVVPLLEEVAQKEEIPALREKAIFWLGQNEGAGLPSLQRLYKTISDVNLKEKIIFGISQQDSEQSAELLVSIAKSGDASGLREKAIFWLSQQGQSKNVRRLADIYPTLTSQELKKKVVFALSQIGDAEATKQMIAIYHKENDRELKKQIIFWLGQSDSPEAQKFLDSILNSK